ncbi:MAG: metallophosphoesterase [Maritimibacter sp.]
MTAYAIGDIHGHLDKLTAAHALIEADRAAHGTVDAPIIHIGDLCDRGPDTKGVLDYLIAGHERGENWVTLKGNHDRLMEWWFEDFPRHDPFLLVGYHWLHAKIGGMETLASYGVVFPERTRTQVAHEMARETVPQAHINFVANLPLQYRLGDLFFCHAGIRPGVALEDQDEMDLLWIREEFHESKADHGAFVIHGHTPVETVEHHGNRLNIDTGAAFGKALSVVVIDGRNVWRLTQEGRINVDPI